MTPHPSAMLLLREIQELTDDVRRLRLTLRAGAPDDGALTHEFVARRLDASVIRPLAELSLRVPIADLQPVDAPTETDAELWTLAKRATRLQLRPDPPTQLHEAVAALQDLACRSPEVGKEDVTAVRLQELHDLQADLPSGIQASTDGPYLVTNAERLVDWLGQSMSSRPQLALCRCGASALKPLCDGSHARVAFSGAKDPERVADRRDLYAGQQVTILDNRGTCQHSGLCTERVATAFRLGEEPFVLPSGGRMDELVRAVRDCPSGALSYALDGVEARDDVDRHHTRDPTVEVTRDGPYRVTGGLPLTDGSGAAEPRNHGASREHYALCRCGHSRNKPFCSGTHWAIAFQDPVPDPETPPTMYEWCGGLPALTRMTRLFYEKHVPQDPMLAPIFATMSVDHPERVATWLGEVFGGPPHYSERYGGYPRMLAEHVGRCLTEEWRARWVTLLLRSAAEAGLPNDAEFRAAFQAYLEWGSRLAVENSQSSARPPTNMPMPRWDWTTGAGPPGGRVSALAPVDESEAPAILPADDEPVAFEKHIRPLFRSRDRQSMLFALDLWSLGDVTEHAPAILERLENGSMPCDGAWPSAQVDAFRRWVNSGKAA